MVLLGSWSFVAGRSKEYSMHAHYLQHVQFEGLGCIRPWLLSEGYEISSTRLYESITLPSLDGLDLLVVMGGPMSVNDKDEYPWLAKEKAFIRRAIDSEIPVLGICLGAQLIASAMGANVYPNPEKEIGWFPVQGTSPSISDSLFRFPPSTPAFHWHGETFDLPQGATRLASSEGCLNQAFQLGTSAIGMQFHLETTPESAQKIVSNCRDELAPSRYVQTEAEMLSAPPEQYHAINSLMRDVLTFLREQRG
jgi:GMP synthase-like glutamine amidotransferase